MTYDLVEQKAIQVDKERWLLAHKMLKESRVMVLQWLDTLPDADQEDFKRRLNKIRKNMRFGVHEEKADNRNDQ